MLLFGVGFFKSEQKQLGREWERGEKIIVWKNSFQARILSNPYRTKALQAS